MKFQKRVKSCWRAAKRFMAMSQRGSSIDKAVKINFLLKYAVMYGDDAESERLHAKLRNLAFLGDKQEDT